MRSALALAALALLALPPATAPSSPEELLALTTELLEAGDLAEAAQHATLLAVGDS